MTAFAFILGCVPLWMATGSGAVSRQDAGHGGDRRDAGGVGDRDFPDSGDFRRGRKNLASRIAEKGMNHERPSGRENFGHAPLPLVAALLAALLAGCTVGPNYQRPTVTRRPIFAIRPPIRRGRRSAMKNGAAVFPDEELQKLIRTALSKITTCASRPRGFCRRKRRWASRAPTSFRKSTAAPDTLSEKIPGFAIQRHSVAGAVFLERRFLGTIPAGDGSRAGESARLRMEPAAGDRHA